MPVPKHPSSFFKSRRLLLSAVFLTVFFVPLAGWVLSQWLHPTVFPDADANEPDAWQLREQWFNQGRQTHDPIPAAAHRLMAWEQAQRLPVAVPRGGAPLPHLRKPFSGPSPMGPPGPSCDWAELGPSPLADSTYGNVSGRVTSLAADLIHDPTGNLLYVGAAYGGVWKTTNGLSGAPTFTPLSDPTQSLAVGALAVDGSVTPPILYVGTGELNMAGDSYYGLGILTSSDGGNTWTLASTANAGAITFAGLACSKIWVDPSSPATVLAAMGFACCHSGLTNLNQGIYRSTDHGATWNQVATVNGGGQAINGHSFTDIVYDGSATVYAAVRFQGVYASTDFGASWTQMTSPFPSGTAPSTTNFARASLAFNGGHLWCLVADNNDNPSQPVTAQDTGLFQSNDGGNTWSSVSLPVVAGGNIFNAGFFSQGEYDQYLAVPPGTSGLLAGGIDLFSAATVNGTSTSWTNLTKSYGANPTSHPDQHAAALVNANLWYIGNDGGVWSTANGGGSFTDRNTDIGTIQFESVSPDPAALGSFIGGAQDNGSSRSNGGLQWTEEFGGDGGHTDTNTAVLGQYYGTYYGIGLYRLDNFGSAFVTVVDSSTIPSTDSHSFYVPYKVVPGATPLVVYGTSRVWEGPGNASLGAGWSAISPFLIGNAASQYIQAIDICPANTQFIYASTTDTAAPNYQVFMTNNGGTTWINVSTGLPATTGPIAAVAVDPTNPQKAYAGLQDFVGAAGSGHVFATTNAGGSWTDITGTLPDAPVNSILVDPLFPADIYVGTDVGVFATQNNGASWAKMGTLLPDTTVFQIKMSTTCPRVIAAATHGRGAWSICPLDNPACPTATPTNTPTATPIPTATIPAYVPPVIWPNPSNGNQTVNLHLTLSATADLHIRIYTTSFRKVKDTVIPNIPAGSQVISLDTKDRTETALANGLYYLVIDTGQNHIVLRMLILR